MSGERDNHYTTETPGGVPSCKGFEEEVLKFIQVSRLKLLTMHF